MVWIIVANITFRESEGCVKVVVMKVEKFINFKLLHLRYYCCYKIV